MTFEEQFPSLKGYIWLNKETDVNTYHCNMDIIVEHCIDKQKVKEVIEKLQVDDSGKGDFVIGDVKEFKKELGL